MAAPLASLAAYLTFFLPTDVESDVNASAQGNVFVHVEAVGEFSGNLKFQASATAIAALTKGPCTVVVGGTAPGTYVVALQGYLTQNLTADVEDDASTAAMGSGFVHLEVVGESGGDLTFPATAALLAANPTGPITVYVTQP